jgi:hypothetical protein
MAEVNEKLKRSKAGQTPEETNSVTSEEGLYQHPEAKNADGTPRQLVCLYDPLFGNAQAEGAIRVGFERVGDVPEGYVKTVTGFGTDAANQTADTVNGDKLVGQEDLKGLQARMSAYEINQKALADENDALRKQLEAKQEIAGGEATKVDAAAITAIRTDPGQLSGNSVAGAGGTPVTTTPSTSNDEEDAARAKTEADELAAQKAKEEEDAARAKALSAQNKTELLETATNEGVELTADLDTNDKIREAIQAKRDAATKESEQ